MQGNYKYFTLWPNLLLMTIVSILSLLFVLYVKASGKEAQEEECDERLRWHAIDAREDGREERERKRG